MPWRRITLYLVTGIAALLLIAIVLLLTVDFGRFKNQIESAVTNALERELRIEGPLHARLGRNIEIYAERASLANPDGSTEPYFVTAERLDISINTWSLIRDPLVINRADAEGIEMNLEVNEDGSASWEFEGLVTEEKKEEETIRPRLPVVLDDVEIRDSAVSFRGPARNKPLEIEIESLQAIQEDDEIRVSLEGLLNGTPISLDKTTGPVANIVNLRDVETTLKGTIGEIVIQGFSKFDDLLEPRRPEIRVDIHGPNAEYLSEILEMPVITRGPMEFEARVEPKGEQMQLSIVSVYGEFDLRVDGEFNDLQQRTDAALDFFADGPDIGSITRPFGLEYEHVDPFELRGKLSRIENELRIEEVFATIGESRLTAEGFFGEFPSTRGAQFKLEATGPDFGRFNRLFGLPGKLRGKFTTTLELAPQDDGRTRVVLEARAPHVELIVNGALSAEPEFVGSTATVHMKGPDIGTVAAAAGAANLPAEPFEIQGDVARDPDGYKLQDLRAHVGDDILKVDGFVANQPLAGQTKLTIDVQGSDLGASVLALGGAADDLPKGAYHLRGRVEPEEDGLRLRGFEAAVGDNQEYELNLDGLLTREPSFVNSEVSVTAHGASLSAFADLLGIQGIPDYPFDVTADMRRGDGRTFVNHGDFEVGNVDVQFSGFAGDKPLEQEAKLTFDASVTDLRAVIGTFDVATDMLPPGDLTVSGSLHSVNERVSADGIVATMNDATLKFDGAVGLPPEFEGTGLHFNAEGKDLSRLLPEDFMHPALHNDFAAEGTLTLKDGMLAVGEIGARLGNTRLRGDISLTVEPPLERGSFSLRSDSPNLFELLKIPDEKPVPDAVAMRFTGRGSWTENYWNFDEFDLRAGKGSLIIIGSLDGPPDFDRTDLQVELNAHSLRNASALAGRELPDQPARLTAHLLGSRNEMVMENFDLTLGDSDLSGQFHMYAGDSPKIELDVQSKLFDISEFQPDPADQEPESQPEKKKERLIPDTPLPMEQLQRYDADVDVEVGELRTRTQVARDLALLATLQGGALKIDRFGFIGQRGGKLEATASLAPNATGVPDLNVAVTGNGMTMGLTAETDEELRQLPVYDVQAELQGRGATVRELAGSMNGFVRLVGGSGRVKQGSLGFLTEDFLSKMLETINPFAKTDPYVGVDCTAVLLTIDDGVATGKPALVQQTDKVRILADASVDLKTEELDAGFSTTPRKGLGISLSNLVNPYVRVSGTLAKPSLAMDTTGVLVEGGAAVATVGLSIVAKSFHDRFLTAKDPCAKAVADADKLRAGSGE